MTLSVRVAYLSWIGTSLERGLTAAKAVRNCSVNPDVGGLFSKPNEIAQTRIPAAPSSAAAARCSAKAWPGRSECRAFSPSRADTTVLIMTPRSPPVRGVSSAMSAAANRMRLRLSFTLALAPLQNCSTRQGRLVQVHFAPGATRGQLTRICAGPCASRAAATAVRALSAQAASYSRAIPPISAATDRIICKFQSNNATLAPAFARARAVASPNRDPPPATSAARPRRFIRLLSPVNDKRLSYNLLPSGSGHPYRRRVG